MLGRAPLSKRGQDINMALELILQNNGFYPYRNCSAPIVGGPYGAYCTLGSQYRESMALLDSFVYDAAADVYRYLTWHNQVDYPSWSIWGGTIDPETGVLLTHAMVEQTAVAHAWTSTAWNGGLNKLYATYIVTAGVGEGVVEITRADLIPTDTQIANPIVNVTQIPNLVHSQFAILVCPERQLITLVDGLGTIDVYDYSNYPGVSTKLSSQPFSDLFGWSAGYEDDQRIWMLFSESIFGASNNANQTLLKYNFLTNRMELLTELQPGNGADRMALIAFDTKRKKLGAFRIKDDAPVTGAPVNAFEIYAPRPAMTRITVPVNLNRLAPNVRTQFRAHLVGTKAEGGTSRVVEVDNVNSLGALPRKQVYTEESGAVQFEYRSSTDAMTDTITTEFNETKVII